MVILTEMAAGALHAALFTFYKALLYKWQDHKKIGVAFNKYIDSIHFSLLDYEIIILFACTAASVILTIKRTGPQLLGP